ncbi:MAG TPA: radical SAM protein [Spirochaetota bacterium]|nr:radical SAM protein [Spirochaetota bacterium]
MNVNMKKLVLVSIHIKNSPQAMPLAAALLKAQLDSIPGISDKLDVSFTDFYAGSTAEYISGQILKEPPDFIGFSTYLWNRQFTEEICRIIKQRCTGTILFAGGAEATALPYDLLDCAPFDFVVKGEGELVLAEVMKRLVNGESYNDVDGVCVDDGAERSGVRQCPVMDLDSLPSPFLTGVLDVEKYSGVLWELSRGCPFRCSFCFESRGVAGVRQFSLERLQEELELFESKKVNQVFVLDPTFNRDIKRAKKILRMIQKTAPLIHFTFEVRTEFIDAEMAGLFASVNCSLQIGLQSAVPEVLSHVNRNIDPDKYADKISLLNSAGVIFGLDLIYGLPGDTLEGFKHSLGFALDLQPNHLDIFPLAVLPGTALYDDAGSFNLNYRHEAPYTLISSPGFSEQDMITAESLKNACDILYNQGGAAGWMFMVTETLGIDPAELVESFIKHIPAAELSKQEITDLQSVFVKEQFGRHKKNRLFPVIEDIIKIHGAMNRSLYAGPYNGELVTAFSGDSILKLSPGTIVIELKYDFNDLLSVGELDLEEFLTECSPEKTCVIIYNCGGQVKPLIADKKIIQLLQGFTGALALKDLLKTKSLPGKEEAYGFIEYALSETIIFTASRQ